MGTWKSQLVEHKWALVALFIGVCAPLLVFGVLAEDVWSREGFAWDTPLLRFVHGYATPAHDSLMIRISQVGGVRGMVPLCVIAIAILLVRRRASAAAFLALAYGGAAVLDGLAKAIFHSARPHLWVSPAPETGYGFPSGHAMGSMGLIGALVVLAWATRWRWPAILVGAASVAAIGLSRIYLGVHFPSDVLAAWSAALAWVVGLHLVLRMHPMRRVHRGKTARPAGMGGMELT